MNPGNVEIIYRGGVYDVLVNGRFRNYFATFGQAVAEYESIVNNSPVEEWLQKHVSERPKKSRLFQAS